MPDLRNVNDFSQLYRRKITKTSDGSETFRLKLDRIDARTLRVLSHVTVENQSKEYTKCRLGIQNTGIDHYLDELITIAKEELAVSRSDILLGEGDVFFAELTDTANGNALVMVCVGWEQRL